MGITFVLEKKSLTDLFYNDLQKTIKGFHGRDLLIVADFNLKLGKKDSEGGRVLRLFLRPHPKTAILGVSASLLHNADSFCWSSLETSDGE